MLGDRWTLLILRDAFLGTRRFEDFQAQLGATRHLLADRLRKLVAHGVLSRERYCEHPPRFEYRLTEKGRDLYPVIIGLVRWGDRWMADETGPPLELIHRDCGHSMMPEMHCPKCSQQLKARDVFVKLGPALRAQYRHNTRTHSEEEPG